MTTEPAVRRRNTVLAALETARRRHPQLNMKGLIAFLYVAENPGIQMVELAEVSQLTLPTASRIARALYDASMVGALPPYVGLLRMEGPELGETGARKIVLTETGLALCAEFDRLIALGRLIGEQVGRADYRVAV